MKKYFVMCLMLLFVNIHCLAAKSTLNVNLSLGAQINKLLKNFGEDLNVGLVIEDIKTGKILFQKNAHRYFMPASNEKLFTALAALDYLGAGYVYETKIFVDVNKIRNSELNDNLYLQFTGDPTLTFAQLEKLINTITKAGIKRINGSIIIDDSFLDQLFMSPGTSWDDEKYCYAAPVHSIILDHNCVTATLKPAPIPGQFATLMLPSQPQFVRFINLVSTKDKTAASCQLDVSSIDDSTYLLTGCIKVNDTNKEFNLPIRNPRLYLQSALIYVLDKYKIANNHIIQFKKIPNFSKSFANVISLPLPMLITSMLKDSDNLIANAIFKTMGAIYLKQQGSWRSGAAAVHYIFLNKLQLNFSKAPLIDGDGASRYNFVTPEHIISLLNKVYYLPYRDMFISALPIAGIDGTLRDRMKDKHLQGRIRAKTGTMTAVSSLSGYLITNHQHTLAFTILINGFVDSDLKYKTLEEKICDLLIENG